MNLDWDNYTPKKPKTLGVQVFQDYDLGELRDYIDWTPFFASWQMRKKYPAILSDTDLGEEATKLFNDAQTMLDQIISEKWLTAKAVIGLFPANAIKDDDIEIYDDENRTSIKAILRNLRQQNKKAEGKFNYCLTDFVAPKETSVEDYVGMFAVTTGIGIESHVKRFEESNDDYNAILLKALADRLAEAFTELMHEKVRKDYWGYAADEKLGNDDLIKESYKGIRPAPGYPACPEHTEKKTLWQILDVENQIGIKLTDSCAMYPAASVSGWYFSHPESRYFGLGMIDKSQVKDYADRKGMTLEETEKWLSPSLSYDR